MVNITEAAVIRINCDRGEMDAVDLKGLEFKKLQKFVFSVVLREHMFLLLRGKDLLGDKHFSSIKKLYNDDHNLDDSIYPILINAIDKNDTLWATVQQPYRGRNKSGQNLLTFTGGGYEFNVVVQSHFIPADVSGFRLKSSGCATIPIIGISDKKSAQTAVAEAKKLRRGKNEDKKNFTEST